HPLSHSECIDIDIRSHQITGMRQRHICTLYTRKPRHIESHGFNSPDHRSSDVVHPCAFSPRNQQQFTRTSLSLSVGVSGMATIPQQKPDQEYQATLHQSSYIRFTIHWGQIFGLHQTISGFFPPIRTHSHGLYTNRSRWEFPYYCSDPTPTPELFAYNWFPDWNVRCCSEGFHPACIV